MDMRVYYRKIREKEDGLPEDPVVVVSLDTPDGGKAGILTEVSRRNAARLLVEGRAEVASEAETTKFRQEVKDAKTAADEKEAARRMEFTFVSGAERKSGFRLPKA
jgi:sRNA-binding protein